MHHYTLSIPYRILTGGTCWSYYCGFWHPFQFPTGFSLSIDYNGIYCITGNFQFPTGFSHKTGKLVYNSFITLSIPYRILTWLYYVVNQMFQYQSFNSLPDSH